MEKLPREIRDEIMLSTNFETVIKNDNKYAIKKLYNPKIHTWKWAAKKWTFRSSQVVT